MIQIKFSHIYKKFPDSLQNTRLVKIDIVNLENCDSEFLARDTETISGNHYPLPKRGKFMILWLDTVNEDGKVHFWQTIRRWTSDKEAYYRSHVGEQVECVVVT